MKKIIAFVFTVVMIFSLINKANATTLTFDELTNEVGCWEIKDIYRNLGWYNINIMSKLARPGEIYEKAAVSGDYLAYNGDNNKETYIYAVNNETFTLNDGYFLSVRDTYNMTAYGFRNNEIVTSKIFELNTESPKLITFNFSDIDKVLFQTDINSYPKFFAMDNLRINEAVPTPEPSAMVLGLLSLGGLFGFRKRNKKINA